MVWRGLLLVGVCGCGRIAFDARGDAASGDASDAGAGDGPALTCMTTDFNTAGIPAGWGSFMDPNCSATVVGGQLAIQLQTNANGYAGINTNSNLAFDFTSGTLTVEVPAVVSAPMNAESYAALYASQGIAYTFYYELGQLNFNRHDPLDTEIAIPYSATEHRHWQFAHDAAAGEIVFLTSPDRMRWDRQFAVTTTIPINALRFELSAGTYNGGTASPGSPRFDNVTLCLTQ